MKQSLLRDMDNFETASLPLGHSGNIACTLSEKSVDSVNANHHFEIDIETFCRGRPIVSIFKFFYLTPEGIIVTNADNMAYF